LKKEQVVCDEVVDQHTYVKADWRGLANQDSPELKNKQLGKLAYQLLRRHSFG
jgi:hypothetical protein